MKDNYLDNRQILRFLGVILYIIFLLVLLRNDVRYLKIQTVWYHDDTEWKYHEWGLSEIRADGTVLETQEAYPDIIYSCIPYSPSVSFKTIQISNPGWKEAGLDSNRVSLALGNFKLFEAQLEITDESVILDNLEAVWSEASILYYGYVVLLAATFAVGIFVIWRWFASNHKALARGCRACGEWCHKNRKTLIVWSGIFLTYAVVSLIVLKTGHFFEDQQGFLPRLEWCVYIGAVLCIYVVSYCLLKSRRAAILTTLLACVPLFLSIHDITLYQTKDERNNITELMWLSQDVFRHWSFTNAWTHYLLMGTAWKLLPEKFAMVGIYPIHMNAFQTAKVIHWLCGFFVTMGMTVTAYRSFPSKEGKLSKWNLSMLFLAVFSLPVWVLGMKMYNYDLFSMLFCVCGVLYGINYLFEPKMSSKTGALLCMGFALQEKEFVIVYMLIIMVLMLARDVYCNKRKLFVILADSLSIYLLPLIPIVFTDYWVSMILRGGDRAVDGFRHCLSAYTKCPSIVFTKMGLLLDPYRLFGITYIGVIAGAIFAIVIFRYALCKLYEKKKLMLLSTMFLGLFVCMGVMGVVFAFKRENIPMEEGGYAAAHPLLANVYGYIGYVPTVYLLIVCILFLYLLLKKSKNMLQGRQEIMFFIAAVILGGITWVNILLGGYQNALEILEYRYQNIQQLLNIICIWLLICLFVKTKKMLIGGIIFAGTLLETVWSLPGFVIFYPLWNVTIYKEGFLIQDDAGMGNGTAGEKIEEYCLKNGISLQDANIYSTNFTPWGDNNYGINCQYLKNAVQNKDCKWRDNDFYVVFSNSIMENNVQVVIPEDIVPIMKIQYRGVDRIWIYQGIQLKDCYPFDEWQNAE